VRRVNPKSFFAELKRRNVYKVAVAYAVVGWVIAQIATQIFPFLEIPNWVVRLVVVLIAIGFPIALVIAWAFEATPEGIKRTEDVDALLATAVEVPAQATKKSHAWIYIVIVGALLSIGLFLLGRYTTSRGVVSPASASLEKSIAVLPFESLSDDKANAYFATGIQDEIMARLAKIADLKVISRTSTQRYKSAPADLREIAKQLGVANILEGSVQKAGDQVRVSVQLINALHDSHTWAETYDRKLIDVFQVESDVAQKIANALEAKLTGKEKAAISSRGTENPQAYDAYLRAIALRNSQSKVDELHAIEFCRQAVALDPNFAEAWAELAVRESSRYFFPERTEAQKERARVAAETAVRLAPELPDAQGAMGLYYYYCLQDYDQALARLDQARAAAPHNGKIIEAMALVKRRQGKLDEAIALQKQATQPDPLNIDVWVNLASSYRGQRKLEQASAMLDRALAIAPNDPALLGSKAEFCVAGGDFDKADELVRNVPHRWSNTGSWIVVDLLIYRKQFDEAIRQIMDALETEKLPPVFVALQHSQLAFVYFLKGDGVHAKQLWRQSEQELKALREQGQTGRFLERLVEVEAYLGQRDEFEVEAQRFLQMRRKDKWTLPRAEEARARGYAILGDADRAIPLLEHLLQKTAFNALTPALLRFDPMWDPIRNDPRFQKLANAKQ
jgi:TolB-like protein/Tfp pilus assembly protein PilF